MLKEVNLNERTSEELVRTAIWLDREQKEGRSLLNRYKAELEKRGLKIMEDLNTHYVKFFASEGKVAIADSSRLDILNPDRIRELIGEGVYRTKIKENVKTEYKVDAKLERALKAVFQNDYTFEQTLEEFLSDLQPVPSPEQKRILLKKLKGDYEKDRDTLLEVLQLPQDADLDVELWYIYKIKNAELIKAFLPEEGIDSTMEAIRRCILVDSKTSVTLDYDSSEKKEEKEV